MKLQRLTAAAAAGMILPALVWLGLAAAAPAGPTHPAAPAEIITTTVTLTPDRDNTLYENPLGTVSNGAGQHFFAGTTQNGDARRGVLAFDLSGLPPGATVITATLSLTMSKTTAGDTAVALHLLSADWGEGDSDAVGEEGAGATAVAGDATWLHTFFDTGLWAQPGGDFAAVTSAAAVVGGPGVYAWSSPALSADLAGWLADPAANFGWALIGDETAAGTAKRFDSRENDPANRPRLTITYSADAPETQTAYVPVILR